MADEDHAWPITADGRGESDFSMPRAIALALCGWMLCLAATSVCAQAAPLPGSKMIQDEEVLVRPSNDWSAVVTAPGQPGERVMLRLQARLHVAGGQGGGCNWLLRLLIDDQWVGESFARPRLLNKAPFFDFADGKYHFSWYNQTYHAWMTMFADNYDTDTAGTGEDSTFLLDIGDYVRPGQEFVLRVQYAQPNIPAVLKADAPVGIRRVEVGAMSVDAVRQLRDEVLSGDQAPQAVPIEVTPAAGEQAGEVPYEIAWAGRSEQPPAQVSFESLAGWKAMAVGDAEIKIAATRTRRTWREQTARVSISQCSSFVLSVTPPSPIRIPDDTTAVNAWVYSDHTWQGSSPVEMLVTIVDSEDRHADLPCGQLRGRYWELRQGLLPGDTGGHLRPPLYFESLTLSAGKTANAMELNLESLAFFKRERVPFAGISRASDPPFPTSPDNMLPPAPDGCETRADRQGDAFVFTSMAPDGVVSYAVRPGDGGFADIQAHVDGGVAFQPMAGAGIVFSTRTGPVRANASNTTLLGAELNAGVLSTRWAFAAGDVQAEYELQHELRGRTLMVGVSCPGGQAEELSLGKVWGLPGLRGIEVPYLVLWRVPSPRVAMGDRAFCSVLPDWYYSNSSAIDTAAAQDEAGDDGLCIAGKTAYERLTDGTRNDLAERILVTVSPEIHDTLPSIATPRSERMEELAPSLYIMNGQFTPEYHRTLRRYGIDSAIAIHFAGIWWTEIGEGFGARWRPRPDLTEADVADYRAEIKSLGYGWGMLVNYTCFAPFNEYWDENKVSLNSSGGLWDGWYGHYRPKPNAMQPLAREVGERIRARYPTDCVYLDVHTNVGAGSYDFEAGVPGAGMGREVVLANGAAMAEVHAQQHALCSEGICRWMYAGIADMDYAQWVDVRKPNKKPLLPDFDLLRIHPKQIGTAMGYSPTCFFDDESLAEYYNDPCKGTDHLPFYQYVAATLAHGHSAMIGYGYHPALSRILSYYALLSGPQEDYLPDTVADIAWYSDAAGKFVPTSDALRTGVRDDGKLRVSYRGGQVVHVNYHAEKTWRVSVDGREFELPPYGWVIHKPGMLLSYSALMDGRRVDYVQCPRYTYLNSGDKPVTEGAITVDGAVLITRGEETTLIPCGDLGPWGNIPGERYPMFGDRSLKGVPADRGVRALKVDLAQLLGVGADTELTMIPRAAGGELLEPQTLTARTIELTPSADVEAYVLR